MFYLITALKAFCIGAAMTVPGVSGGTLALLLDVYDRLVSAVSNLFRKFKENFLYLLIFGVGGVIGMLLLSKLILFVEGLYPIPVRFFFIGAIIGGVPLLWGKTGLKKITVPSVLFLLGGVAAVFSLSLIPKAFISVSAEGFGILNILSFLFVGIALAVALIVPGISFSHMLLIFGIYDRFFEAIESLDIVFLLCVLVPTGLALLALVKGMDYLMKRFPSYTFSAILGFVIGSLKDVFIAFPTGFEIPAAILTFLAGAFAVLAITFFNPKK